MSTGDFQEALAALLGKDAPNLSPAVIARLTAEWQADYDGWRRRDLSARRYVYVWADGVYLQARMEDAAECMLVRFRMRFGMPSCFFGCSRLEGLGLWMVVRIRAKMAQRKKLAWPLRSSQLLLAVERLVANDGWVASRVKAVSRRRRGPRPASRACHQPYSTTEVDG